MIQTGKQCSVTVEPSLHIVVIQQNFIKLHIGTLYRGKRFWTHQIPSSCLPILLIFIHIYHTFVYAHFSSHFSKQLLMTGI
jgi:hypothetical protein